MCITKSVCIPFFAQVLARMTTMMQATDVSATKDKTAVIVSSLSMRTVGAAINSSIIMVIICFNANIVNYQMKGITLYLTFCLYSL